MRKLAFAAMSIALIQAPCVAQIAIQSTPDVSPRCVAAGSETVFQIQRVADLGNVSGRPLFFFEAASRIAAIAADGTARLFDATGGGQIGELYPAGREPSLVAVSPDGEVALWSDGKGVVDMRRMKTGELVAQPVDLQRGVALFSPDSSRLVVLVGGTLTVLDGKLGAPVGTPVQVDPSDGLEFSSNGARLIIRRASGADAVIDLRIGLLAYEIAAGPDEKLKFDDEGERALLIGPAGWKLLDPDANRELAKGDGEEARFSIEGAFVLADGPAGVRVLDSRTGRLAARPGRLASTPEQRAIDVGLEISPDTKTMVTRSPDGIARLWDLARSRGLAELGLFPPVKDGGKEETGQPRSFQFTPDGTRLITHDIDGRLTIWDTVTGRRIATIGQFTKLDLLWVADDGAFAVAILADGSATLWNTRSGWRMADMGRFSPGLSETQFLLSPDRRVLLISDRQRTEFWDVDRGARLGRRPGQVRLSGAAFSANGAWLALRPNAEVSAFEIWNALTGAQVGEARPADGANFYRIAGEDVLFTRSAANFALWDMKRGERAITCQFADPNLSMMEVFPARDALLLALNVGGGHSELWRIARR